MKNILYLLGLSLLLLTTPSKAEWGFYDQVGYTEMVGTHNTSTAPNSPTDTTPAHLYVAGSHMYFSWWENGPFLTGHQDTETVGMLDPGISMEMRISADSDVAPYTYGPYEPPQIQYSTGFCLSFDANKVYWTDYPRLYGYCVPVTSQTTYICLYGTGSSHYNFTGDLWYGMAHQIDPFTGTHIGSTTWSRGMMTVGGPPGGFGGGND